jgi:hypothetical protein
VFYKFENGKTQFYFNQDYKLAYIMYSKPGSPTDVLKVTHVRERTFSDEDFVIAGCTV